MPHKSLRIADSAPLPVGQRDSRGGVVQGQHVLWLGWAAVWGLLLWWPVANAQVVVDDGTAGGPLSNLRQPEREILNRWRAIQRELNAPEPDIGDLPQAIQELLDLPGDAFITTETANGKPTVRGFKQLAEEALQSAPPAVRDAYAAFYNTEAQKLLDEARSRFDLTAVSEVYRRFGQTPAGAEAALWLARYAMDHGEFWLANQMLERLHRQPSLKSRFEPMLSIRRAICQMRLGQSELAERTFGELLKSGGDRARWPVALRDIDTEEEARQWLQTNAAGSGTQITSQGWYPRNDAARSGKSRTHLPFGRPLWQVPLLKWSGPDPLNPGQSTAYDLSAHYDALAESDDPLRPSLLPAGRPLIVGQTVIVRFCDHLTAFEAGTGRELWRTIETDRTFRLLREMIHRELVKPPNHPSRMGSEIVDDLGAAFTFLVRDRLWFDRSYGTLSSNGQLVFSLEDLPLDTLRGALLARTANHPLLPRDYNRLVAHDVHSGQLRWEVGGPAVQPGQVGLSAAGHFLLGAPLPLGNSLAVMAEYQGEIRLLMLSAATGDLEWSLGLAKADVPITNDQRRRYAGLSPTYQEGILLCPTEAGAVIAVDLLQRRMLWAGVYRRTSDGDAEPGRGVALPQFRMPGQPMMFASLAQWQDQYAIVSDQTVLLTPAEQGELLAFDLRTGRLMWRQPRNDQQYVLGVDRGIVVVVAPRELTGLRLATGEKAWGQPVPPCDGRGALAEGLAYLPLRNQEIASFNIETGQPRPVMSIYDAPLLGNLVANENLLISESATSIAAFWPIDKLGHDLAEKLKLKPDDPELLALRGEYHLALGEIVAGVSDLRISVSSKPTPRTRSTLYKTLLSQSLSPPAGLDFRWEELLQLAQSKEQRVQVLHAWAVQLKQSGDLSGFWKKLLELSAPELGPPILLAINSQTSVRLDRWIGNEVGELWNASPGPWQEAMQRDLQQQLQSATSVTSAEPLRRFLRYYFATPLAREARWKLLEKLLAERHSAESDLLLGELGADPDPVTACSAVSLQCAELIKLQLPQRITPLVKRLEEEFADVRDRTGKTGRELAVQYRAAIPAQEVSWPAGKIDLQTSVAMSEARKQEIPCEIRGTGQPFMNGLRFVYRQKEGELIARDEALGEEWRIRFSARSRDIVQPHRLHAYQNLLSLTWGGSIRIYDTLAAQIPGGRARLLWEVPVAENDEVAANPFVHKLGLGLGQASNLLLSQRTLQSFGNVTGFQNGTALYSYGDKVQLMDALTGQILWKWLSHDPVSEVIPAGDRVIVVHEAFRTTVVASSNRARATILDRRSGLVLNSLPTYGRDNRMAWFGSRVLTVENQQQGLLFALTDVLTGETVWSREAPQRTHFQIFDQADLLLLEPDGDLTRVRIADGTDSWQIKLPHPNLTDFLILPDREHLVLACSQPIPLVPGTFNWFLQIQNLSGYPRFVPRGFLFCLKPETGELVWEAALSNHHLDPLSPADVPVWLVLRRIPPPQPAKPEEGQIEFQALDRKTGQIIWQHKVTTGSASVVLDALPTEHTVRITLNSSPPQHLDLKFTGQPTEAVSNAQPPAPAPAPVKKPDE